MRECERDARAGIPPVCLSRTHTNSRRLYLTRTFPSPSLGHEPVFSLQACRCGNRCGKTRRQQTQAWLAHTSHRPPALLRRFGTRSGMTRRSSLVSLHVEKSTPSVLTLLVGYLKPDQLLNLHATGLSTFVTLCHVVLKPCSALFCAQ